MKRGTATKRLAALALGTALAAGAVPAYAAESAPAAGAEAAGTAGAAAGTPSKAEVAGEEQAALVANEDAYATEVRTLTTIAQWQDAEFTRNPYRLQSGVGYTLVLTARAEPYRIADLLALAPQTFVKQPDGSYLLSERIFVDNGATLEIEAQTATTLRLQSGSGGFVSIVSLGGSVSMAGTKAAPLTVLSHDPTSGKPDTTVTDGRAYIHSIGGTLSMDYVDASNLGFWSGRTGGVALTGTEAPSTGQLGGSEPLMYGSKDNKHLSRYDEEQAKAAVAAPPTLVNGTTVAPAGPIGVAGTTLATPDLSYVGGSVNHSRFSDNAYGLFVSGAEGVSIKDNVMEDNLYAGVMLHRYVSAAVVERTIARDNGGDGFVVTRAAEGVQLTQNTAEGNAGNGFTLNGTSLAEEESAAGMSLRSYGNHTLSNSVSRDNGGDGVEVLGAINTRVQNNDISGNAMGIVVREDATGITVMGNQVGAHVQHGISVRDGASDVTVVANLIEGSPTGIYVRDATADVRNNTIDDPDKHAVSLVGAVGATAVVANEFTGAGYAALDTYRVTSTTEALKIRGNDVSEWSDIRSWVRQLRRLASPLTLMWTGVIGLVVVTAIRGRRRQETELTRPYSSTVLVTPPMEREKVST